MASPIKENLLVFKPFIDLESKIVRSLDWRWYLCGLSSPGMEDNGKWLAYFKRVWLNQREEMKSLRLYSFPGFCRIGTEQYGQQLISPLSFPVSCSHLNSDSTSTLTVAISNTSYSPSSPIELLLSSNNQISSPPESSGYSEELCTFVWPIKSANQPGKNEREHRIKAQV